MRTSGPQAVGERPLVELEPTDHPLAVEQHAGITLGRVQRSSVASVTITYADGAREDLDMTNMVAMGGPSGWRMNIGTEINPAPGPTGQ